MFNKMQAVMQAEGNERDDEALPDDNFEEQFYLLTFV